ncbi:MAG: LPS export ABC transporter permease LptG [Thiohalomonadales bacterium]
MKIINRYINYTILTSMMVVLFVLLSLFTFFSFLEQLEEIGQGNYGVVSALYFVLLSMPTMINQLFPITALLGVTIGLGLLSSNSELIAIRSAGVSMRQIVNSVLKVGTLLMIVSFIIGEWVSPRTEQHAQMIKSVAKSEQLSLEGDQGLWARDGKSIINVRKILPGGQLGEIFIYTYGENYSIREIQYAESAIYIEDHWKLKNLSTTMLWEDKTTKKFDAESSWETKISPDLLSVVTVKSSTQSTYDLYKYIAYLENNGVSAEGYKQSFWSKVSIPLVTGVMVLLAIPFVFGSLRSVGISQRILVGVLLGIGFHLVNQTFSYLGLVFKLDPAFSALFPTAVAFLLAVYLLRRVY